jgi:hypothetical protein
MQKTPSYWTKDLFESLEVGESHTGNKGSTHRVYLMNIVLKPKKFVSRENGTKVERIK